MSKSTLPNSQPLPAQSSETAAAGTSAALSPAPAPSTMTSQEREVMTRIERAEARQKELAEAPALVGIGVNGNRLKDLAAMHDSRCKAGGTHMSAFFSGPWREIAETRGWMPIRRKGCTKVEQLTTPSGKGYAYSMPKQLWRKLHDAQSQETMQNTIGRLKESAETELEKRQTGVSNAKLVVENELEAHTEKVTPRQKKRG